MRASTVTVIKTGHLSNNLSVKGKMLSTRTRAIDD